MQGKIQSVKFYFIFIALMLLGMVFGGAKYIGDNDISILGVSVGISGRPNEFDYLDDKKAKLVYEGPDKHNQSENARFVKVLVYHGISENEDNQSISWDKFRDQLFTLKENGYETITISALEEYLHGQKPLPKKSFLITFDDGRKDSYYPADPVLKALNYNAVMFVITSHIDEKSDYYLSESELHEMIATGRWEIQAHADEGHKFVVINENGDEGHFYANKIWREDLGRIESNSEYQKRIMEDLFSAKSKLKETFGITSKTFAVPYGDYGQIESNYSDASSVLLENIKRNYDLVFYQSWNEDVTQNYPLLDAFMVKRVGVESDWTPQKLLQIMNKS